MAELVKAFRDFVATNGWAYLRAWTDIVTRRSRAFDDLDLGDEAVFVFATKFMMINALLCCVFELPPAALSGFNYASVQYVGSLYLFQVTTWIALASLLHACMIFFRGTAKYRETVSLYFFLTAFHPPLSLLQMPLSQFLLPILARPDFAGHVYSPNLAPEIMAAAPPGQLLFLIVFVLASNAFFFWYISILIRASLRLHGLAGARAFIAAIAAFLAQWAFVVLMIGPLNNILLMAFAR